MLLVTGVFLIISTHAFAGVTVTYVPVRPLVDTAWSIDAGKCMVQPLGLGQGETLYGHYKIKGAVDNRLDVSLIDERNYALWRAGRRYAYFTAMSGTVRGVARLRFTVPRSGVYFALFCNNKALFLDRSVKVTLYTTDSSLSPADIAFRNHLEKQLSAIDELFILPNVHVAVRPCGIANAFSSPAITICTELLNSFPANIARALSTFVFLHEFSHTALHLWHLPGTNNEDVADEFATALLLMGGHREVVKTAARRWASQAANVRAEALAKITTGDRHSLTIQRARNLHRWMNNDHQLILRWATLLAPHFADSVIESMANDPRFEHNVAIQREYARRFGY